jgi:hypothetical protein
LHPLKRNFIALAALLVAALALVACGGGGGGDEASSDTDVDTLLEKTFSGGKDVKSGKIDLSVKASASGSTGGSFDVALTGPFESEGTKKLPKFALKVSASGQGQNIEAGATSTGEKGFVNFNGEDYVVSDEVFAQFKQGYEEAAAKNDSSSDQSLASLGLDPKKWLTNPENAGEAKVGDTDVIRITGGLDVPKFLDDLNTALSKAGQLGVPQGQLPTQLTDEQRKQVEDAIEDVKVEIATGKEDMTLRQMKVDLSAKDPESDDTATVNFDLQLIDLNEGQEFPEPADAKPFDELLSQFGGLGGLSGLNGGADASGADSGSTSGASQEQLDEYSQCLEDAGSDLTKAQECASVLQG